jgi:hypothetical protein
MVSRKFFLAAFGVLALALNAQAAPILFQPAGNGSLAGAILIDTLDQAPGNAAQLGTIPFTPGGGTKTGPTLFQSNMSVLQLGGSNVFFPGGANNQLITLANFPEQVTVNAAGTTATFALGAGTPNFFQINSVSPAGGNNQTGAGFDPANGTPILRGHVVSISGTFTVPDTFPTGSIDPLNGDPRQTIGTLAQTGSGSQTLVIRFDGPGDFVNPLFFPDPTKTIDSLVVNSQTILPFSTVRPLLNGGTFLGGIGFDFGAINGISGPDILLQTDLNTAIATTPVTTAVPEPTTMLAWGLCLGGLAVARHVRKSRKAKA